MIAEGGISPQITKSWKPLYGVQRMSLLALNFVIKSFAQCFLLGSLRTGAWRSIKQMCGSCISAAYLRT